MRSFFRILILAIICTSVFSCYVPDEPGDYVPPSGTNYSSMQSFWSHNEIPTQTYAINGTTGGTFTTPQGTQVTIPANAFVTQSYTPVSGIVQIEFKDLYKKSDMLFANVATTDFTGAPLKSGGEFFIRATFNDSAILIAPGKEITVRQPAALTGGADFINEMTPFIGQPDSAGVNEWVAAPVDTGGATVVTTATDYIYTLYSFSTPVDSGTWCNSDNSSFFDGYTQTTFTIAIPDVDLCNSSQVFLVFTDVSSMIHVYSSYFDNSFPYDYAPLGLHCTIVAVGLKNHVLHSAFVPVTIGSNQTVELTLQETTEATFKSSLEALN